MKQMADQVVCNGGEMHKIQDGEKIMNDINWYKAAVEIPNAELNIAEEIAAFIRRFVFFRDEVLYDLVAAWVVTTHVTEMFEYGYLFAYSPEPQSGKSRLLEILDLLVRNSSGILVSPTEAVLFRTAKNGTQLLDEVDSWGNKDALKSVLNAGFRSGGSVLRMREKKGDYEPVKFPVYGPRALAGIGTGILDVTTRDRTFMLEMVRQTKDERREQLRMRKTKPEADGLKDRILKWTNDNKEEIEKVYDQFGFPYLADSRDRTIDIAQPIATVIEVAYSVGLETARSRLMEAIALTRKEERLAKDQHKVIRQLLESTDDDPLVGSATELSAMCSNLAEAPSSETISATLRMYGFKTKSLRKGGQPAYRYELPRETLLELLERYAVEELPEPELAAEEPQLAKFAGVLPDAKDAA